MKWVFLYACTAFSCADHPSIAGDGVYYESKPVCVFAARDYARRRLIRLGRWEIVCVERQAPS